MQEAPELIANYECKTGENPLWHAAEKRLYWCDIPRGHLFRYDPQANHHERCYEGQTIGGFTVERDGALLCFMERGAVKRWCGGVLTTVVDHIPGEENSRFNDVIADPMGRVFCGTMSSPEHKGRLYRLDLDGTIAVVREEVGCSNGMAFSRDGRRMFHTDADAREIYVFDYDVRTGAIANGRLFVRSDEADGFPDGATIDSEDCLWSAHWDGGCLIRYTQDGREERRIAVPAKKASSLTFGGGDYRDIYVTTAAGHQKSADDRLAGSLFRIRAGVTGVAEYLSAICS
jgi:D-xylonolactonase